MAQNYRHLWWQMVAKNDLTKRAAWGAEMFQLFLQRFQGMRPPTSTPVSKEMSQG